MMEFDYFLFWGIFLNLLGIAIVSILAGIGFYTVMSWLLRK